MTPADSGRRNIYVPDELWGEIQQAAASEGARRGRPLSVSEWLREAAAEKIAHQRSTVKGGTAPPP